MPIKPDTKYNGRVRAGSYPFESQSGTPGYQVNLECEDGATQFVIWLTEKNRERARKNFETLGVNVARFEDPNYIEYQLAGEIVGREVSFGTKEETYRGETKVKVAWIGRKSEGTPVVTMAKFFGGKEPTAPASNIARSSDDEPPAEHYEAEAEKDDLPF